MEPALWTRLVQIFGTVWLTCCVILLFPVLPLGWWIAAVLLHGLLGLLAAVLYLVGNALVSALALYESKRNVGRSLAFVALLISGGALAAAGLVLAAAPSLEWNSAGGSIAERAVGVAVPFLLVGAAVYALSRVLRRAAAHEG